MSQNSQSIWSAQDASASTAGEVAGPWFANGVSIDTRTLQQGDLFVALKGDAGNGHDYVLKAIELGAAAAIVDHPIDGVDPARLMVVEDTLEALEDLGRASRARSAARVIGVTGSVGKTTTKEMLAMAFSVHGQTHASKGSYNNHWGVPLTLASMHEGTDFGVFEMGMNHVGELTPLSQMVKPHIAIITNVAAVHMEHFKDLEEIAMAKAEIFNGVVQGGTVILNKDIESFSYLYGEAVSRGLNVRTFGEQGADAYILESLEASNGSRVRAMIMGELVTMALRIPGHHIVMNSLAVLLAVKLAGQDVQKSAKALEALDPIKGRGFQEALDYGEEKNPVTLIDESYNASPISMRAAFKVLALIDPGRGGRRIAVLGDMRELGQQGPQMHADLALPLQAADVQLVYTCGPLMKNLYDALPQDRRGVHTDSSQELAQIVPEVLVPGDVVMVKGSNGSKMGVVVEAMRKMPAIRREKV
jgi:UDP-N-acetylmuramoyl-tripeptide--D-alanyl-D-alanine ligase